MSGLAMLRATLNSAVIVRRHGAEETPVSAPRDRRVRAAMPHLGAARAADSETTGAKACPSRRSAGALRGLFSRSGTALTRGGGRDWLSTSALPPRR
eukprot:scaffold825_cov249-Pinguiococcus_pyrenoidosus.AAC.1